jgi:predicted HAD superfamily hydrolase
LYIYTQLIMHATHCRKHPVTSLISAFFHNQIKSIKCIPAFDKFHMGNSSVQVQSSTLILFLYSKSVPGNYLEFFLHVNNNVCYDKNNIWFLVIRADEQIHFHTHTHTQPRYILR